VDDQAMRINKDGRVTIPARLRKELDIRFKAFAGAVELIVYARRRRRSVRLLITKAMPANTRAIA
jgi:bifunctional DNA-binding transcriptional regulator/antitoxin component of YhaV-PrlF toxin-antitoxin module